ncbi:MAG: hypothetical protein QM682_03590 [Paracoccus sp. (in: a-proteobacteria)]|uniref:hypothetical protein n=1 Tax=Paracoccus sp. TaxID=267 RepID=UPI0039E6A753
MQPLNLGEDYQKTTRIEAEAKKINLLAKQPGTARRLQTMPGIGPLTALAVEAAPALSFTVVDLARMATKAGITSAF